MANLQRAMTLGMRPPRTALLSMSYVRVGARAKTYLWLYGFMGILQYSNMQRIDLTMTRGGYFMGGSGDRRYNLTFIVESSDSYQ